MRIVGVFFWKCLSFSFAFSGYERGLKKISRFTGSLSIIGILTTTQICQIDPMFEAC